MDLFEPGWGAGNPEGESLESGSLPSLVSSETGTNHRRGAPENILRTERIPGVMGFLVRLAQLPFTLGITRPPGESTVEPRA